MGVVLVSMSADAFILLMPTGGAAPACFTAPAGVGSGTATFSVAVGTAPFTLCP
jgi:superfamily II DNA helicase RecQ